MARRRKGFGKARRYGLNADITSQIGNWIDAGKDHFTLEEMVIEMKMDPTHHRDREKVYSGIHKGMAELVGWIDGNGKIHEGHWDYFVKTKEYQDALNAGLNNAEIWKLFIDRANKLGIYVYIGDVDFTYYQPDYISFHAYRNQQLRGKAKALVGALRIHESIGGKDGMALPSGKTMGELALPLSQAKALLAEHVNVPLKPEEEMRVERDLDEIKEKYLAYYVKVYDDILCPICKTGKIHAMPKGDYRCSECKTLIKEDEIEEVFAKESSKTTNPSDGTETDN